MTTNMNFIGQRKIVDFFDNSIKNGCLAHAYCFVGLDEIGKRALSFNLAAQLLGIKNTESIVHPDFIYLAREKDEKTDKLKKDISVKQIRDLRSRLQNRSWLGGYQVVIIDEAEQLNQEAGNSFLKILEEPAEKTVYFLLTADVSRMLPTVRSRCQFFYFAPVPALEIKNGLLKMGCDEETAGKISNWAWGRPGRAMSLWRDEEARGNYVKEAARWQKMLAEPFYAKLKDTDEIFGDKTDHIRERGNLQKILDVWTMLWRDVLLKKNGSDKIFSGDLIDFDDKLTRYPSEKILEIIECLKTARTLMGQNVHPRLLVEQVLLKF